MYMFNDGSMTEHPPTKEQAIKDGKSKYWCGDKCDKCGSLHIRYTTTDNCHYCTLIKMQRIAWVKQYGKSTPYPDTLIKPYKGATKPMDDGAEILKYAALDGSVADKPCKHGHIHIKNKAGKCIECTNMSSARQTAIDNGEKWYTPSTPCKKCYGYHPRRVDNGQCSGCKPSTMQPRQQTDHGLPDDTIMSREDARLLRFKVYRTGKPCKHGHTGFRRVDNGGCVECMKIS
jgi:hypothetical protein